MTSGENVMSTQETPFSGSTVVSDYIGGKWTAPRPFMSLINEAAPEAGASVCWLSDDWIARLEKGHEICYVHGASFPLNSSTSGLIAEDKVSTYIVLSNAGVAAMPHHLVRFPNSGEIEGSADRALALVHPPLVIKPATEGGGLDVYRVDSIEEAHNLIGRLAARYHALAVCPFETILTEHRVVMLDGEPQVFFRKELNGQGEWRHNLKHGARPILEESPKVRAELAVIADQAMNAIRGRFMTVDIIRTPTARMVLEINGSVMLDHFAAESQEHRACAVEIYRQAISRCF
jgi:glutathione synthase/RimK-type ligase-like ATP-grasp enzyme